MLCLETCRVRLSQMDLQTPDRKSVGEAQGMAGCRNPIWEGSRIFLSVIFIVATADYIRACQALAIVTKQVGEQREAAAAQKAAHDHHGYDPHFTHGRFHMRHHPVRGLAVCGG